MHAELVHDAGEPRFFPSDGLPEVAVLGRSNVGKSTLLNALVGRRGLARTSSTPGRTRRIHFYQVEKRAYLVDLPGFGYARLSQKEQRAFAPLVDAYLRRSRATLKGALVLIDARRGAQPEERELFALLEGEGIPARAVLTKCDQLKARDVEAARRALLALPSLRAELVAASSAKDVRGLAPVVGWLREWTGVEFRRPDGAAFV